MVEQNLFKDLERNLIEGLFEDSNASDRCPNLRRDEIGPYCGRNFNGGTVSIMRRCVCDSSSLQLWCLDKGHYNTCIWYKGEPFR